MRLPEGAVRLVLRNTHTRLPLLISRVVLQWQRRTHLQLSLPSWLLAGEPFTARVWSESDGERAVVTCQGEAQELVLLAAGTTLRCAAASLAWRCL